MKIKVLLLALGCTMGTLGAYAQKGVDNGTQFGSGEDSVRCITNISLFVPYEYVKIRPELRTMIDEQYFRFTVNYTFNELWFFKRKVD